MKKKYKILFVILLLLFILLFLGVKTGVAQAIDNKIYGAIQNYQNESITEILKGITNLGGTIGLFCIALLTVLTLFLCQKRKYGIAIALNLMISTVSYFILKNLIQRPRPPVMERLIEETAYSFPSGHSTNNMAFYALAICLVYQNVKNKKLRNGICIVLAIIPILIGFSRFYLRVHYISDVLAGFCLGIMCVILFMSYGYQKIK